MATSRPESQPKPPFPEQHQESPGDESRLRPRPQYLAERYRGADKLLDRVALVTGGDSGIGRAVAVLFAREGADVAIVHLPEEQGDADETLRAIEREGRRGLSIAADVRGSTCLRNVSGTSTGYRPVKHASQNPAPGAPVAVISRSSARYDKLSALRYSRMWSTSRLWAISSLRSPVSIP